MTKKKLLERIEEMEGIVGRPHSMYVFNGVDFPDLIEKPLGYVLKDLQKEVDILRETQKLLFEYLKVEVKETPGQPAQKPKKEIMKLSTPPQHPKSKNPKKRTLRK